jgi:hypothetical protein
MQERTDSRRKCSKPVPIEEYVGQSSLCIGRNLEMRPAEYESIEYDIFNCLWPKIVQIIRSRFLAHTGYCTS